MLSNLWPKIKKPYLSVVSCQDPLLTIALYGSWHETTYLILAAVGRPQEFGRRSGSGVALPS